MGEWQKIETFLIVQFILGIQTNIAEIDTGEVILMTDGNIK
jgi:hypothetical protein